MAHSVSRRRARQPAGPLDRSEIEAAKTRPSLVEIVGRHVQWDRSKPIPARGEFWACCPFHVEKSPSFHVSRVDGTELLKENLSFPDALKFLGELSANENRRPPLTACEHSPAPRESNEDNRGIALAIWDDAQQITGTLAESYLNELGICLPGWPECLRFHPECPRGNQRQPALIALFSDIAKNEPRAISRRFLTQDGVKDGKPLMLGPAKSAVVKLSPDEQITLGLGLAEGIETGLSVVAIVWHPVWACGSTETLRHFPVLGGVEGITVFADNDENCAGFNAATECAQRHKAAGVTARIIKPRATGEDWNDRVRGAV